MIRASLGESDVSNQDPTWNLERDGWIVDKKQLRSVQPNQSRVGSSGLKKKKPPRFFSSVGFFSVRATMSAYCLDLQTSAAVSAPLELDSDCMEPRDSPGSGDQELGGGFQPHPLRNPGSGGLGMALEEELAMLTRDRSNEDEEEKLLSPELETPVVGHNADLLSLFRQKERDLVLAAKLGKALLERNQDLTKQYEKMHKDLNEKLEVKLKKENVT